MIKVLFQQSGKEDRQVMLPQVPQQGERVCFEANPGPDTTWFRVVVVFWVVPPQNASPWAIVEITY